MCDNIMLQHYRPNFYGKSLKIWSHKNPDTFGRNSSRRLRNHQFKFFVADSNVTGKLYNANEQILK